MHHRLLSVVALHGNTHVIDVTGSAAAMAAGAMAVADDADASVNKGKEMASKGRQKGEAAAATGGATGGEAVNDAEEERQEKAYLAEMAASSSAITLPKG